MGYSFLTVVGTTRKHQVLPIDMNPGKTDQESGSGKVAGPRDVCDRFWADHGQL
jgi:hypothetical protein